MVEYALQRHLMPLVAGCAQIASLDRNWRLYGGTTGPGPQEGLYQENTTLFPDLVGFFKFIHDNHLHIFFNVRLSSFVFSELW